MEKTAFEQAGEAQEWQIASACSNFEFNGCSAQPQAGLSGRISTIVVGVARLESTWTLCSLGSISTKKRARGPGELLVSPGARGHRELLCGQKTDGWAAVWPELEIGPGPSAAPLYSQELEGQQKEQG